MGRQRGLDVLGHQPDAQAGYGVDLHGKTFKLHIHTPDGTIINTGDLTTYDNTLGNIVGTSYAFTGGETVWVEFAGPSNTDGSPNWVYGVPTLFIPPIP